MQVVLACGANVVTGHLTTGGVPVPENAVSDALTPVTVVFPVLVTRYEYVTVWPAAVITDGDAVFSSARPGPAVAVTVAVDGSELAAGPVGGVPDATAADDRD